MIEFLGHGSKSERTAIQFGIQSRPVLWDPLTGTSDRHRRLAQLAQPTPVRKRSDGCGRLGLHLGWLTCRGVAHNGLNGHG